MTKKQARAIALAAAYHAIQKALDTGGNEAGSDVDDQILIEDQLDTIAQAMYERWQKAVEANDREARRSSARV